MSYTIGQAAKATGKHKTTISKAIKKGIISATIKEDGSYNIDPAELHRVYPPLPSKKESQQSNGLQGSTENLLKINQLEAKLEAADQEKKLLYEQIKDLRADKEFLQGELKKSTLLLTTAKEEEQKQRAGFWARIFGRNVA